uniref:Uncharacterized protein n=1 Tax=Mastacembelus armatus TaxID=205130 RepID=A0A3Q3NHV4_9TELE
MSVVVYELLVYIYITFSSPVILHSFLLLCSSSYPCLLSVTLRLPLSHLILICSNISFYSFYHHKYSLLYIPVISNPTSPRFAHVSQFRLLYSRH